MEMTLKRIGLVLFSVCAFHHVYVYGFFGVALTHPSGSPLVGLAAGQLVGIAKETYAGAKAIYPFVPKPVPYTTSRPSITLGELS